MTDKSRQFLTSASSTCTAIPAYTGTRSVTVDETVSTEGHPYQLLGKTERDIGGPFVVNKTFVSVLGTDAGGSARVSENILKKLKPYTGALLPYWPPDWVGINSAWAEPTDSDLWSKGGTAIARCEPTNAVADTSVFVGELFRDGIPSWIGSNLAHMKNRSQFYKELGNEYLNVEFGWRPFIADLRKFAKVVVDGSDAIEQLHRDSGRTVRRGYAFPPVESVSDVSLGASYPRSCGSVLTAMNVTGTRDIRRVRTISNTSWFEGAFTYHVDLGTSRLSQLNRFRQEANYLLGLEISPDILWNLTPWSWAADWFGNTGDILHNLSAFGLDGLVMRYGYVMNEHKVQDSISMSNVPWHSANTSGLPSSLFLSYGRVQKRRVKASPFGFGLDWSSFTPRQLAIVGALGLTQSPKSAFLAR